MNAPRVTADGYIQFLIGSPVVVSATEAARVQPSRPDAPAHDAFTRLLHRLEPDPATLWEDVRPLLDPTDGVLVIDDSTLDEPRAKHIELVRHHWSGNHRAVVSGINLVTLLWSDGDRLYPTDYRVYHKTTDGKTKNGPFAEMLDTAHARGLGPKAVLFDGWYASVANLKRVRGFGWVFVTRLPSNRKVRIARGPAVAVSAHPVAASGRRHGCPSSGWCGCSGESPRTATRHTGRPTTWAWRRTRGGCSPSCPGGSRSTTAG